MNPGVDLVFAVDWDAGIDQRLVRDHPLPELTGIGPAEEAPAGSPEGSTPPPSQVTLAATGESPSNRSLAHGVLWALGVVIVAIAIATLVVRSRRPSVE